MYSNSSNRKKVRHYNSSGHAHELTFSCYRRLPFLEDKAACEILQEEIGRSRDIYSFRLWAYVIMPNHVHLLIWPTEPEYDISKILSGIKGMMSKRYRKHSAETDPARHDHLMLKKTTLASFTFWQPGGGFDRNFWNAKAIHDSIHYIEANPVRKKLAVSPEEWQWSSAFGRKYGLGLVPDEFNLPVLLPNPQAQRIGVI